MSNLSSIDFPVEPSRSLVDTHLVNCPRDETELREVAVEGTTIDICPKCDGKWLDQGELERLVLANMPAGVTPASVESAMTAAERPTFFDTTGGDPELTCPRCRVIMQKVQFQSGDAALTADRCSSCQGFWLDTGESGSLFVFLEEKLPIRGSVWAILGIAVALGLLGIYWIAVR